MCHIYNVTLENNGQQFSVTDIFLTDKEGGQNQAIQNAIELMRNDGMLGAIVFVSIEGKTMNKTREAYLQEKTAYLVSIGMIADADNITAFERECLEVAVTQAIQADILNDH